MNRKVVYGFAAGIILAFLGFLVGLIIGTYLGGNYFPSFKFMSSQGYEAVGYLGAIIGTLIGLTLGVWLGIRGFSRTKNTIE